jgi:hypothetical protein
MLDDGAGRDFAQAFAVQVVAVDQALQRERQHVLIRRGRVGGVRAGKRNPVAADDGDAAHGGQRVGHARLLWVVPWLLNGANGTNSANGD